MNCEFASEIILLENIFLFSNICWEYIYIWDVVVVNIWNNGEGRRGGG